ncbi:hypothetical protein E1283_25045 [Streptomyces hainanensis]|uniref:Uncharacterized protein n=1 Tax=Streptomyces hainanensis TaxID=402648 RepID=A0A4V2Y1W2_9ACTN|nr:hypothetical protein E1283_25045 [Streptomyces hainanensis]
MGLRGRLRRPPRPAQRHHPVPAPQPAAAQAACHQVPDHQDQRGDQRERQHDDGRTAAPRRDRLLPLRPRRAYRHRPVVRHRRVPVGGADRRPRPVAPAQRRPDRQQQIALAELVAVGVGVGVGVGDGDGVGVGVGPGLGIVAREAVHGRGEPLVRTR